MREAMGVSATNAYSFGAHSREVITAVVDTVPTASSTTAMTGVSTGCARSVTTPR